MLCLVPRYLYAEVVVELELELVEVELVVLVLVDVLDVEEVVLDVLDDEDVVEVLDEVVVQVNCSLVSPVVFWPPPASNSDILVSVFGNDDSLRVNARCKFRPSV